MTDSGIQASDQMDARSLEEIIDRQGMVAVLEMLAAICEGKAERLLENWADYPAVRSWDRNAKALTKAAARTQN